MVRIVIFFLLFPCVFPLQAQKYNTAVGLRFGNNHYGITARQRVLRRTSLEGLIIVDPLQYNGTLLLQQHFPIIGRGFNIYMGPGVHVGEQKETGRFYGVDIVIGAEMKLPALPFIVSADIKPAYHFDHGEWFDFSTALSIHYVIGKDTKSKKDREKRKKKRLKERQKRDKQKNKQKEKRQKERERGNVDPDKSFWNFDFLKRNKGNT